MACGDRLAIKTRGLDERRGSGGWPVDAVIVCSGTQTRDVVADPALLSSIDIDPARQLIGAQRSGALVLARLGVLRDIPACTDLVTQPWLEQEGIAVLNRPFYAQGNLTTAGGCLASQYLAAWMIARLAGVEAAQSALSRVAPVGEEEQYIARAGISKGMGRSENLGVLVYRWLGRQ